ncbi:MAG: hypothetical protein WD273_04525 [Trueperaceae bacterium]
MYERSTPDWRSDAKWFSGILLVLTLTLFVPLLGFSQLSSRERAQPILESILRLTLLPPGSDGVVTAVREDVGYSAGGELELLPGSGVFVTAQELPDVTAQAASERIARALSESVITEGAAATAQQLEGSELGEQFDSALDGTARDLVRGTLVSVMMPAGLANGSRLANWPLQAQQNPGEPVQPVVGVFVRVPPAELQPLNVRQIGELIVVKLADILLAEGLEAAREQVTNINLLQRLDEGAIGPIREQLTELFATLLLSRENTLAQRLEQARSVEQAQAEGSEPVSLGVATGEELAGLDTESANELVLSRLAERAYEGGSDTLLQLVNESDQATRLTGVAGLVDALSERAHGRYLRFSWMFGVVAALLLVLLVALSRGWGRLANPGLALALSAAGGALLALRLSRLTAATDVTLPTSLNAQGVFGYLVQLLAFTGASFPDSALALMLRNHLALLILGAALILLSLLLRLARGLRSRRRSFI